MTSLPTQHSSIYSILQYGSIYSALESKHIDSVSVLEYLLTHDSVSIDTRIAYRAVCKFSGPEQIILDQPFILQTKCSDYLQIYFYSFMGIRNLGRNDNETRCILEKIWSSLSTQTFGGNHFHLICNTGHEFLGNYGNDELKYIFGCRSDTFISTLDVKSLVTFALLNDHLQPLTKLAFSEYGIRLFDRCNRLSKLLPDYWANVAEPKYRQHVISVTNNGYALGSWDLVLKYRKIFPGIFETLFNDGPLISNLKASSLYQQAYLLGFPIHYVCPSPKQIEEKIQMLKELGTENYCKKLIEQQRKEFEAHRLAHSCQVVNTENVQGDDPCEFSPLDIVYYYQDNHAFYFTRPEFDYLLEKKKNHFNNLDLSPSLLFEIQARQLTSKEFALPESKPLSLLLQDKSLLTPTVRSNATPSLTSNDFQRILLSMIMNEALPSMGDFDIHASFEYQAASDDDDERDLEEDLEEDTDDEM